MSNTTFNAKDLNQISAKGSELQSVEQQIDNFKKGFPFSDLQKAATIDDGVLKLDEKELDKLQAYYNRHSQFKKVLKFVPASGAATSYSKFRSILLRFLNVNKFRGNFPRGEYGYCLSFLD